MNHLYAVNLATGWQGVSTHALLLLRPSSHIYAAAALSQFKVHESRCRPTQPERGTGSGPAIRIN